MEPLLRRPAVPAAPLLIPAAPSLMRHICCISCTRMPCRISSAAFNCRSLPIPATLQRLCQHARCCQQPGQPATGLPQHSTPAALAPWPSLTSCSGGLLNCSIRPSFNSTGSIREGAGVGVLAASGSQPSAWGTGVTMPAAHAVVPHSPAISTPPPA